MSYSPQTWANGVVGGTPISAARLTHIEDGVEDADNRVTTVEADLATLTKADVGLGNVDNTSDVNKPISTATQTTLNGKAASSHTHVATADLTATGTKNSTTFLRGDDTWAVPAGGGGGGGTVTSVTAGDGTITVAGTATDPTIAVGTGIAQSKVTNLVTDLAAKQPLDSDLTTIAGLTATTDSFLQAKSSAWSARTPTQVAADLVTPLASSFQPLDSDLTTIAGLTATTDNFMVSASSAWASRTPAQAKTSLSLNNVDNTSNATERAATRTLTNARVTKRAGSTTSTSTLTYDSDTYDVYTLTAQAAALTLANPSGTPTDGQSIMMRFKDNGTARALTWSGSQWRAIGLTLPTTTTISKWLYALAVWQAADSKWDVIAVGQEP